MITNHSAEIDVAFAIKIATYWRITSCSAKVTIELYQAHTILYW